MTNLELEYFIETEVKVAGTEEFTFIDEKVIIEVYTYRHREYTIITSKPVKGKPIKTRYIVEDV